MPHIGIVVLVHNVFVYEDMYTRVHYLGQCVSSSASTKVPYQQCDPIIPNLQTRRLLYLPLLPTTFHTFLSLPNKPSRPI